MVSVELVVAVLVRLVEDLGVMLLDLTSQEFRV